VIGVTRLSRWRFKLFNIFVSSTYEDLKSYREEVRGLITALGFIDMAMEKWPPTFRPPINEVTEAVNKSDVYVGIFAWRYGSRIEEGAMSYTEYEYELAKEKNIPRLIFLVHPEKDWPVKYVDIGIDGESLRNLRNKIKGENDITWKYFDTEINLVRWLSAALFKLIIDSHKFKVLDDEQKAILNLRQLINADLIARRNQIEYGGDESSRDWFITEIKRCNVGEYYVQRNSVLKNIAMWLLKAQYPYLFLVGPAGIGKTNFLISEIIHHVVSKNTGGVRPSLSPEAVLFLPLGFYHTEKTFLNNLREYIHRSSNLSSEISIETLMNLIKGGRAILILDGLDEFVRTKGEEKCNSLFQSLRLCIDPRQTRVIISCRNHIYKRLKNRGLFKDQKQEVIDVPPLTTREVEKAIETRLGKDSPGYIAITSNQSLIRFAQNPLLLEMMCRISRESWKRLIKTQTMSRLYDLWFEEIIATSADPREMLEDEFIEDTRKKVGKIAGLMLKNRSDLIDRAELEKNDLYPEYLRTLIRLPFGIFVQQTPEEWGFVHDSFREFALAKTVAIELTSKNYDLLAHTSSFDYVGAETYSFLKDLLPTQEALFEHIREALSSTKSKRKIWNNLVRNSFEAIGIIGDKSAERFIETALGILQPTRRSVHQQSDGLATEKTKYNIIRCIERLHPSAPRPYYQHVLTKAWDKEPSWHSFGAKAVRGFHRPKPHPDFFPPMIYEWDYNTNNGFMQKEVSRCLLTLLEQSSAKRRSRESRYTEINSSFALVRWLYEDHIHIVKKLLNNAHLTPASKGNLFHALLRFKKPEIFDDCTDLLAGMELCWVYISQAWVSRKFIFKKATFRMYDRSKLEGFLPTAFDHCIYD